MKIGTMMITAGVVALGLAAWNTPSKAQGPMYDRVNVNLPYSVTIGDRTLQPGDYVIQQLRDQGGGSRVLLIYSDNGMKFETSAMTIPALDQNTPENTKVVLHHFGNDYYFDKVWIQGKDYGYEFPVPDSVKARERERMQPISVAATYSTVQQTDTTPRPTPTRRPLPPRRRARPLRQTALRRPRRTTTPAPRRIRAPRLRRTALRQPRQTTTPAATTQGTTAQSAGDYQRHDDGAEPDHDAAEHHAEPGTTHARTCHDCPQHRSTMNDTGSADRSMPNTSAGWLMMLLSGGALSGAGLSLRRKR